MWHRFRFGLRFGLDISFEFKTILIIYDWLGSLGYTANLLKNCGLACISPSYNQNTKVATSIVLLEYCNGFCIYVHCQNVTFGKGHKVGISALPTYLMHVFQ